MSYLSANNTSLDRPLSVNETTQIHSPPKKKLRLSLRGQKLILLGTNCSSPKAFPETKTETFPLKMQNIRPNLLDPMSLHVSYSGSGMGLVTQSYGRMENGDGEYEHERDSRPLRLEPSSTNDKSTLPPVATLLNLGNTCFLNSVLYTLRFTPRFAHLLHHLAADLTEKKLLSLGGNERRIGGFLSSGSPGLRTKSLTSLTPYSHEDHSIDPTKRKTLVLTERLHELFQTLHNAEQKGDLSEPFQSDAFLQALREVNPLFQGNQQQDAHELLVCLLDYLRDACQLIDKAQLKPVGDSLNPVSFDQGSGESSSIKKDKQSTKKKNKKIFAEKEGKKGKRVIANNAPVVNDSLNEQSPSINVGEEINRTPDRMSGVKGDFISESFEGVTVLRTTCLECEYVTERKECFMDICVPIISDSPPGEEPPLSPSAFFASTLMEVDFLRDTNKYWCEQCVRYNEARRSVHYEKLPRLLILQLKRFSLSFGSTVHTSKVNDYMPTPMQLDCFCEHCQDSDLPLHSYRLYAIIMHLGATMASGHYVAYTRVCPSASDYASCSRGFTASSLHSSNNSSRPNSERYIGSNNSNSSGGILRFFKPKSSSALGTDSPNAGTNIAPATLCRSVNCCSARPRKLFPDPCDKEKENSGRESPSSSSSNSSANNLAEDIWLECDDEVIRVLRMRELEDLLCKKPRTSALTPYLLFYVQVNPTATTVK